MLHIKRVKHSFITKGVIEGIVKAFEILGYRTYNLYVDLTNSEIYVSNRKNNRANFKLIGEVKVKQHTPIKEAVKNIYEVIKTYTTSGVLICKTTAVKSYGKQFVDKQNPYVTQTNPYYSCANEMLLFNKDVLEYLKMTA